LTWQNVLAINGEHTNALLASCRSRSGAGLVAFDGEKTELIDTISSTGLCLAQERMVRLVGRPDDSNAPGELFVYDAGGVEKYYRIDKVRSPLDVIWDGQYFVVVSAAQNSLFWLTSSGEVARVAKMPGESDSWHLSCVAQDGGDLFVSAFGRFDGPREWERHTGEGRGIIFNVSTNTDAVRGLQCPQHHQILDGSWLVCNSGTRELLQISRNDSAVVKQRVRLEKWIRGLTFSDRHIFLGESAGSSLSNATTDTGFASIAILDRATLALIGRVTLPFEEIDDLVIVSDDLLQGVRNGIKSYHPGLFRRDRSRSARNSMQPPAAWTPGDLLPREACRARVSLEIEALLSPDSVLHCPCVVENIGPYSFVSARPHPVVVTYRWLNKESGRYFGMLSMATRLPASVPPNGSVACSLRLQTPVAEGRYELQVSLFQKGNGFFGKIDPRNAFRKEIWIHVSATKTQ
jgi:hypothetical protein